MSKNERCCVVHGNQPDFFPFKDQTCLVSLAIPSIKYSALFDPHILAGRMDGIDYLFFK